MLYPPIQLMYPHIMVSPSLCCYNWHSDRFVPRLSPVLTFEFKYHLAKDTMLCVHPSDVIHPGHSKSGYMGVALHDSPVRNFRSIPSATSL